MKHRKPFNKVEKLLLAIPTWIFATGVVGLLIGLILWAEKDINLKSPPEVVRVIFQSAEAIGIVAAVILYFKEIPDRKARKHYEAWQVIDNTTRDSLGYARKQALKDLCSDGVSFANISISFADLSKINLAGADLNSASLTFCDLTATDFSFANLTGANLSASQLTRANFTEADISHVNFTHAHFSRSEIFSPQQFQVARNWETATYDPEIRAKLGLAPKP